MTLIQKNDVVGLTRNLDTNLTEGLVGMVLERHDDSFEVEFPLQGSDNIRARVPQQDVKLIVGTEKSGD